MRRTKPGWNLIVFVGVLIGFVALGCAPPAAPPSPSSGKPAAAVPSPAAAKPAAKSEKVRVHVTSKSAIYYPFYFGKAKGFYKDEGLDLDIIIAKGGLVVPILTSGEAEYSSIHASSFNAGLKGAPVRYLMNYANGTWHVIGAPGVNMIADLKGKSVAVTYLGSMGHYVTKAALSKLGLDTDKEVTFVSVPSGMDQFMAVKSKTVGAAALLSPFDLQAQKEGMKELVNTVKVVDIPSAGLAATIQRVKENPNQVKSMMRAMLKALAYVKDNPKETMDYFSKEFEVDAETAKATYDEQVNTMVLDGGTSEAGLQALLDFGKVSGALTEAQAKAPLELGMDLTLLKEVQKELKLTR